MKKELNELCKKECGNAHARLQLQLRQRGEEERGGDLSRLAKSMTMLMVKRGTIKLRTIGEWWL